MQQPISGLPGHGGFGLGLFRQRLTEQSKEEIESMAVSSLRSEKRVGWPVARRLRTASTYRSKSEQRVSIGIIGAGALGSNVARLLAKSGISATIANSRGPESLMGLVKELGPLIKAGTAKEAASADIVLVAAC